MGPSDTDSIASIEPPELSETQLREQYENAEIQRYLHIFSTVSVPQLVRKTALKSCFLRADSLSATIAEQYVVPFLPAQKHEIPHFTLARVRLTVNRLYIIAQVQWPRLKEIVELAMWTNFRRSLTGCLAFWFLWWNNLIVPAILSTMLVGLLKRGIFPYPSLEDLKEHHRRISEADEFSEHISHKISPSSTLDIKELYRLYRLANSDWQKKFKKTKSHKASGSNTDASASRTSLTLSRSSADYHEATEPVHTDEATILDEPETTTESLELRRYILYAFIELADFYERARNIAIWRHPTASKRYALALFVLLLVTTFVPTRYLAKGAWFAVGFAFWHVVPVICALSPEDRKRLPPPLADAPTDAQYAMELISARVAKGEDVQATFGKKQKSKSGSPHGSSPKSPERPWSPPPGQSKLKGIGKMIGNEGYRMAKEAMKSPSLASLPLFSGAMAIAAPSADPNLHTFTGQRGSHPGVITLTGKRLVFTPFVSPQSKLDIDVGSITSVKKNGMFKGLHVSYLDPATNTVVEEKFIWISGRDELFARLVGFSQKKWHNV
ncbi:hypothetical protein NMY22_g2902 [Coprinellus aureogranulatus]|nr:hypothetical protein NMY22_g2902 [Coprinellus aureogranulatus]